MYFTRSKELIPLSLTFDTSSRSLQSYVVYSFGLRKTKFKMIKLLPVLISRQISITTYHTSVIYNIKPYPVCTQTLLVAFPTPIMGTKFALISTLESNAFYVMNTMHSRVKNFHHSPHHHMNNLSHPYQDTVSNYIIFP